MKRCLALHLRNAGLSLLFMALWIEGAGAQQVDVALEIASELAGISSLAAESRNLAFVSSKIIQPLIVSLSLASFINFIVVIWILVRSNRSGKTVMESKS